MSDKPSPNENNDVAPDDTLVVEQNEAVQPSEDEAATTEVKTPQDAETLATELAEANDRTLRTQAELENFRKRSRREMDDQRRYAALPLLRDLLTVMDNLQRAIEASPPNETNNGLLEGVKMVASQLDTVFEQHQCKRIEAVGETFDPNLHEALGQFPNDEYPANTVSQEMQSGFLLHERVIRPAQVFVSSGPADEAKETPTNE